MKYRKKPVVIDAVQFTGSNSQEINDFIGANSYEKCCSIGVGNNGERNEVLIETLEGTMRGDIGDWIIKGVQGEFCPCKPDIFEQSYEPVDTEGIKQ